VRRMAAVSSSISASSSTSGKVKSFYLRKGAYGGKKIGGIFHEVVEDGPALIPDGMQMRRTMENTDPAGSGWKFSRLGGWTRVGRSMRRSRSFPSQPH